MRPPAIAMTWDRAVRRGQPWGTSEGLDYPPASLADHLTDPTRICSVWDYEVREKQQWGETS